MKKLLLLPFIWITLFPVYSQQQPAIPIYSFGIWDRGGVLLKDPTNPKYNKFFKGSQLQSGLYFYQFCKGNQVIQTGKFIKE